MALAAQNRPDVTAAYLEAHAAPVARADWVEAARASARKRLTEMGLPDRRDEYWKYTDPRDLVRPDAGVAAVFDNAGESPVFGDIDRLKVVFVDGQFDAEASDPLDMAGLEISRLADVADQDIHWARDSFGALEAAAHGAVPRPFAAANTALASDGVLIRVTGQAARPVCLIYHHNSETSDAFLHHFIRLEEGASMTLLESGPAASRFNKVMEVSVANGASFDHVRVQGRDHERRAVTGSFAELGEGSSYKSFTLTVNGVLTRNESHITFNGDKAIAHVAGAALGDGSDFHHDDTVFVTHDAVGCESRQVFKKVLRNGATGVFQGKILVKDGAQKTDGYQISQALLLDDDAQFFAKPELEIYADDVACSHGSTSGAIDEDGLFYLRARGIPESIAQDLLVLAFLAEALDEIADPALAEDIRSRLESWLERRRG